MNSAEVWPNGRNRDYRTVSQLARSVALRGLILVRASEEEYRVEGVRYRVETPEGVVRARFVASHEVAEWVRRRNPRTGRYRRRRDGKGGTRGRASAVAREAQRSRRAREARRKT